MPKPKVNFIMILVDPRVADWMWMQSPLPTISLILLYYAVIIIGPKIMEKREPFDMKPVLFVFNTAVVILYLWMTKEVGSSFYMYNRCMHE